jgi:hypothetical protein
MSKEHRTFSFEGKPFEIKDSGNKVINRQVNSSSNVDRFGKKRPAFSRAVLLRLIAWLEQM